MQFDLTHATALKAQLWTGKTIPALARSFRPKISAATVGHIRAGLRWAEAPWPDGSEGAMPKKRAREIEEARKQALAGVVL